ncbi:MAG: HD domain-containing protein [Gemmatimonadetes bacterium]|nr:HD domain-containing protein [Gemmatimonadota bacterium]
MSDTSRLTDAPRLTQRFTQAFQYAAELHARQARKGPNGIPYIAHLMAVTALVLEDGGSEDEAIAGLLHDAVEDHPRDGRTKEEIRSQFGERVLEIVLGCTDADTHPKPPWRERKERYLSHIPGLPRHVLRVSVADKLHNARTVLADYRRVGDAVWKRFSVGRDDTLWYYRALVIAFRRAGSGFLIDEYESTVRELERETGKGKGEKE